MQNKRLFPHILLISVALIMAHLCWADEVYKTVDDKGRVTYTDTPGANEQAKEVDLPPVNTQPPIQYRPSTSQPSKTPIPETVIVLTSPANGSQVGPSQSSILVNVTIEGPVSNYSQVVVSFSGREYQIAKGSSSIEIPVTRLDRGEKVISAYLISHQGDILSSASPITVHVIRPNKKRKASPKS